jgi:hypothetical protein
VLAPADVRPASTGRRDIFGSGRGTSVAAGIAGVAWVAAAGVLYRPDGGALPVGCPVHALTGLDCPGCGSTRSLGALVRLDPVAAFDHHLLVPVALVLVVWSWLRWVRSAWTRGGPATPLVHGPAAIVSIGVVLVVFTLVRNLDAASWLASGLAGSAP